MTATIWRWPFVQDRELDVKPVVIFRMAWTASGTLSEDIFMTRRNFKSSTARTVVLAMVAAMAVTAAGPSFAGSSASASKGSSATGSSSSVTDVSAARRHHHHRRYHGHGGNAAAAAAFAGIMGTVGAIAANQARRDAYYDYGPGYYAPPPRYYYGGPRYPSPYGGAYYPY